MSSELRVVGNKTNSLLATRYSQLIKMIQDILEKSQREKSFIGVWVYGDEEGFWSGYVKELTGEYGESDGLIIEKIEHIQSIDFDDDYSKVMAYLIENRDKSEQGEDIKIEIHHTHTWQTDVLEPLIGNKNRIVQIQVNRDSFYSGFVEWVNEENLVVRLVGSNGEDKGKSIFRTEDINTVRINSKDNRRRMLLYKWRKSTSTSTSK